MSSKVVKAPAPAAGGNLEPSKVVDRAVFAAQERARQIVAQAQSLAEASLREAERRAAQALEQASRRGHRDGLAIWQQRCLDLLATYNHMLSELRPQVIELALEASRKILRHHLVEAPESIQGSIEAGLHALRNAAPSRLEVAVNPEDVEAVEAVCAKLRDKDPRWAAMVVRADAEMERGGCRLTSDFGEVDASVETQLDAMRLLLNREEQG